MSTDLVNDCELSMMVASKLERDGRADEAEWPTFLIPHGPDWQAALDGVQHVIDRLRARGLDVVVRNRPVPNGTVMMLTLDAE